MKRYQILLAVAGIALVVMLVGSWFIYQSFTTTKSEAIKIAQKAFPDFSDYPSDQLPPKSVIAEKQGNGWYIAFIQEGSGRPVVSVQCVFVNKSNQAARAGQYTPTSSDVYAKDFSPVLCAPKASANQCAVSSCHGLDYSCGIPPQACDTSYQLGDKCLQYAQCTVQDGSCQKIETTEFASCKSCIEACQRNNPTDPSKAFECESACN